MNRDDPTFSCFFLSFIRVFLPTLAIFHPVQSGEDVDWLSCNLVHEDEVRTENKKYGKGRKRTPHKQLKRSKKKTRDIVFFTHGLCV
jgi:hypothetical protein